MSNPLLGGEEAEGFGVGIHDREPTPALRDRCRCAPPLQGIFSQPVIHVQNSGSSFVPLGKGIEALRKLRRVFAAGGLQ